METIVINTNDRNPMRDKGADVLIFIFRYTEDNDLPIEYYFCNLQATQVEAIGTLMEQKDFIELRVQYGGKFINYLLQYFISKEDYESCQEVTRQMEMLSNFLAQQ